MEKFNRGLEKFWLLMAIGVAAFCLYEFIIGNRATGKLYLIFLVIPIAMYLLRRYIRIRMEKNQNDSGQKKS